MAVKAPKPVRGSKPYKGWLYNSLNSIYSDKPKTNKVSYLKDILEELFLECEHGDEEHRQWLKDKFEDFRKRKEQGATKAVSINEHFDTLLNGPVTRETSIGPRTDVYQDGVLIGSSG